MNGYLELKRQCNHMGWGTEVSCKCTKGAAGGRQGLNPFLYRTRFFSLHDFYRLHSDYDRCLCLSVLVSLP
jgi:hypothetical protein